MKPLLIEKLFQSISPFNVVVEGQLENEWIVDSIQCNLPLFDRKVQIKMQRQELLVEGDYFAVNLDGIFLFSF